MADKAAKTAKSEKPKAKSKKAEQDAIEKSGTTPTPSVENQVPGVAKAGKRGAKAIKEAEEKRRVGIPFFFLSKVEGKNIDGRRALEFGWGRRRCGPVMGRLIRQKGSLIEEDL